MENGKILKDILFDICVLGHSEYCMGDGLEGGQDWMESKIEDKGVSQKTPSLIQVRNQGQAREEGQIWGINND